MKFIMSLYHVDAWRTDGTFERIHAHTRITAESFLLCCCHACFRFVCVLYVFAIPQSSEIKTKITFKNTVNVSVSP